MIEVTGLSKRYGTHLAVENVSFHIKKGEVVGFLGRNGAGKSTIMNILTGYLSLTQGRVEIDGYDIMDYPQEVKKRIGYLPELPPLYIDMKVREYLSFIYDLKKVSFPKKAHINEVMRLVHIDDVSNRLIKTLSKGYRQRVGFAQALIGNPDVLILDEPTVGLDPNQIIEIRNLISKLGKNHTIILSSHILSEIQAVCKRVLIIKGGQIIADNTPDNLSKKLSNDHSLLARIACDENDMLTALKTVHGVKQVVSLGSKEPGSFDFTITPEDGADVRGEVFRRVADRKRTLLSLKSNELSLEQVFLRLDEMNFEEARAIFGETADTAETDHSPVKIKITEDGESAQVIVDESEEDAE